MSQRDVPGKSEVSVDKSEGQILGRRFKTRPYCLPCGEGLAVDRDRMVDLQSQKGGRERMWLRVAGALCAQVFWLLHFLLVQSSWQEVRIGRAADWSGEEGRQATFIAKLFGTVVKLRQDRTTRKIKGLWKREGGFSSWVWLKSFVCQELRIPEELTKFVTKPVFVETIFLYISISNNNEFLVFKAYAYMTLFSRGQPRVSWESHRQKYNPPLQWKHILMTLLSLWTVVFYLISCNPIKGILGTSLWFHLLRKRREFFFKILLEITTETIKIVYCRYCKTTSLCGPCLHPKHPFLLIPVLRSVLKYLLNKLSLCSVLTCSEILFCISHEFQVHLSRGLKREHLRLFQVSDWSCGSGSFSLCYWQILGRWRAFLQLCPAA